jgi:putative spermidine/putrescine transport system permease protein
MGMSLWFRSLVALLMLFLLAPLIVVALMSFSNDDFLAFPPAHWGFGGYRTLLGNAAFARGLSVSVTLGLAVTAIGLACGTAAAFAIARWRFAGSAMLLMLFTAPLLLPGIILGLGLLLVLARLGWLASWPGLMIGHLLVTLPYVIRVVLTALRGIDTALEEAAATLGASPSHVFRRVTLPLMLPGMIAAAALSFLASFDEVVISLFLVGPRLTTLPIEVFHAIEYRADPQISALSVVLIALTAGLVVVVERSLGLVRAFVR